MINYKMTYENDCAAFVNAMAGMIIYDVREAKISFPECDDWFVIVKIKEINKLVYTISIELSTDENDRFIELGYNEDGLGWLTNNLVGIFYDWGWFNG